MAPHLTFMSVALIVLFSQSLLATSFPLNITDDDSPSAYEVLQGYNFPVGLLPKGVVKYDLDESTGRFHVYLKDSCSFSLEGSYQLKYKSTISGIISNNRLKKLSGISVKVLFLWLNILELIRDGDELEFSVGIASASFPIDNFYECSRCSCRLDCVNRKPTKLRDSYPVEILCRTIDVDVGFKISLYFTRSYPVMRDEVKRAKKRTKASMGSSDCCCGGGGWE
ncbi:hypothetical protein PTKIN_Ptkin15bG0086700 [Pterospermum kingtungense]